MVGDSGIAARGALGRPGGPAEADARKTAPVGARAGDAFVDDADRSAHAVHYLQLAAPALIELAAEVTNTTFSSHWWGREATPGPEGSPSADAPAAVINGTPGNDTLIGTSSADTIDGLAGNDTIDGREGADLLLGGDGADTINGHFDNDSIRGGNGADSIDGSYGGDRIWGDDGDNVGGDADTIFGGTGNDVIGGEGGGRLACRRRAGRRCIGRLRCNLWR